MTLLAEFLSVSPTGIEMDPQASEQPKIDLFAFGDGVVLYVDESSVDPNQNVTETISLRREKNILPVSFTFWRDHGTPDITIRTNATRNHPAVIKELSYKTKSDGSPNRLHEEDFLADGTWQVRLEDGKNIVDIPFVIDNRVRTVRSILAYQPNSKSIYTLYEAAQNVFAI